MIQRLLWLATAALIMLTACGGGTATPPPTAPVGPPASVTGGPAATHTARAPRGTPTPTQPAAANASALKVVFFLASTDTPRQQLFEQLFTEEIGRAHV